MASINEVLTKKNLSYRYDENNYLDKKTTCQGCGYTSALIYYESKYNGFRGRCPSCYCNWAES